jgi:predicted nucleotidyltransferase
LSNSVVACQLIASLHRFQWITDQPNPPIAADCKGGIIRDIVRRIVETAQPDKVILFGSQARGDARPSSDFDVLVIAPSDVPRYRRSIPLDVALANRPVEVEVMVYTPEEVDEWNPVQQAFVTTAVRVGRTLYERRG